MPHRELDRRTGNFAGQDGNKSERMAREHDQICWAEQVIQPIEDSV
jgi:hypothetical protein